MYNVQEDFILIINFIVIFKPFAMFVGLEEGREKERERKLRKETEIIPTFRLNIGRFKETQSD